MTEWAETLKQLYALAPRGIQPGLERMEAALALVGDPQRSLDVVHLAGTNGKGSSAAMITNGIRGRRVGLFTSPHLHTLTERFRVGGAPVSQRCVIDTWREIAPQLADVPLTFFETVTVLAFSIFARERVELAVLETGLGGRLDATNVIDTPLVTAITRVALDHRAWLGDDLATVAAEKAGIMKPGVSCVVASQVPTVDAVIDEVASRVGARLERVGPTDRSPRLAGLHQRENAALAVGVLRELEAVGVEVDVDAALDAVWPGRLERIDGAPPVLLDVAHNPNGALALARFLETEPSAHRALVFGAMEDKDWRRMLAALRPLSDHVVLTAASLDRAKDPAAMAAPGDVVEAEPASALARARARVGPDGLVVVTGSTFVVAAARAELLGLTPDPPIDF